jgi:hypothetical protein
MAQNCKIVGAEQSYVGKTRAREIYLTQDRDKRRPLVNTVKNILAPQNAGNLFCGLRDSSTAEVM